MDVFFYGLFMDEELLRSQGLNPQEGEKGYIDGYELRIGERALLIENVDEKAFGMTFSLKEHEVKQLYAPPSVQDYKPIWVAFTTLTTRGTKQVQCYNLPTSIIQGSNPEYAAKLSRVLTSLDFPADYVEKVLTQAS